MSDFVQLVKERRSASNFIANVNISERELNEIFDLVKFGPSAFNLQHAHYLAVIEPTVKKRLQEAANGQHKVLTSSAVIIVLGDKKAYRQTAEIYNWLKILGIVNPQEYEHLVNDTVSFYENRGTDFQRDEAIRNASLSAMLFMLAAKDKGWDTCPMIGFDAMKVKSILNISEQYEAVMMITLGKEKLESRKPRGYRKPVSEFVAYI